MLGNDAIVSPSSANNLGDKEEDEDEVSSKPLNLRIPIHLMDL